MWISKEEYERLKKAARDGTKSPKPDYKPPATKKEPERIRIDLYIHTDCESNAKE